MYYNEQDFKIPHFHVEYAGNWAVVDIRSLEILRGRFPTPQTRLVREWGAERRNELLSAWAAARAHQPLPEIEPLS